jgi:hypothetical protein
VWPAGIDRRSAEVNGIQINYLVGGQGSPVVLLHGFAQTSRERCEHRDAAAKQRARVGEGQRVGQRQDPGPVRTDVAREPAARAAVRTIPERGGWTRAVGFAIALARVADPCPPAALWRKQ